MNELLTKAAATDGLLFLASALGYAISPRYKKLETVWACAVIFTFIVGIPLVIAVIWTG